MSYLPRIIKKNLTKKQEMNEAGWNQEYEWKSKLERPGAIRTIGITWPFEFTKLVASKKRAHEDSGDPNSLFRHHGGGIMRQQCGSLHNGNNDKSKRKLFHSECRLTETTSRGTTKSKGA